MTRKSVLWAAIAVIVCTLGSANAFQTWSRPHNQDAPDVRVVYRGTLSGSLVEVIRVRDVEFLVIDGKKNVLMIPKCPPGLMYEIGPATTDDMDKPETRPTPRLRHAPDPEEPEDRPPPRVPRPYPMPEPDKGT